MFQIEEYGSYCLPEYTFITLEFLLSGKVLVLPLNTPFKAGFALRRCLKKQVRFSIDVTDLIMFLFILFMQPYLNCLLQPVLSLIP